MISFLATNYQLSVQKLMRLESFCDINYHVVCGATQYVLKLFDITSQVSRTGLKKQFAVMWHLAEKGYGCPSPVRNEYGDVISSLEIKGVK